jgi:hypothetical protein
MVDANQPQGRSPITEVALVVSLKNNAMNSSVIPTLSATLRAGSAEGSRAACAAQAKPLTQDPRSIGAFSNIPRLRGCAPQMGRDPSTPLEMTERAIVRILRRFKSLDTSG